MNRLPKQIKIDGKHTLSLLAITIAMLLLSTNLLASVKIRDISTVEGIRSNQLIGYGLVVGLEGTGDNSQNAQFTVQSLSSALERMGVSVNAADINVDNVAAVMVTAMLPPFAQPGSRIDLKISSLGDASSLASGTLLMTQLVGADGQIYAIAQGQVVVDPNGAALTAGNIPNGGFVEHKIDYNMDTTRIDLALSRYNVDDTVSIKNAINKFFNSPISVISSPNTVAVSVPENYQTSYYDFLNTILNLEITPANFARVVIDQRTGTVVMGSDVSINQVAVSHAGMTIVIGSDAPLDGAPNDFDPLIEGATQANVFSIGGGATIGDLIRALNAVGATSNDLIAILQSVKVAGALHADLEII